ncbi:MAG: flagellar biosynthesis protein FlgL [Paenibacillus sp. RIFOXYA1_FULL_44_5]|nr:MAG: flagellar biosynthesis protein FlgL [Paenibacillus sp. RIFOXYA1_FULL_44_5]
MTLRVTNGMMTTDLLRIINQNTSKMNDTQLQLSTGRKINKASDDPVGITYALRYRSELSMNDQYQKNIDAAQSTLSHTDTVLGQMNDVIQRAKEISVQGLNGTNNTDALTAISQELGDLYSQSVTIANDKFNGKYTFNGQMTDQQPYTEQNAQNQSTDTGAIQYQFSSTVTIPVNVNGNDVFGKPTDSDNLFKALKGLQQDFASGNTSAAQTDLNALNSRYDKFLQARTEVGARSNRIDLMNQRMQDLNLNLQDLSSKVEDVDVAQATLDLKNQQNVYQASLSVGAKIIQPSLLDYLK